MSADVFPLLMKALGETVAMVAVSRGQGWASDRGFRFAAVAAALHPRRCSCRRLRGSSLWVKSNRQLKYIISKYRTPKNSKKNPKPV